MVRRAGGAAWFPAYGAAVPRVWALGPGALPGGLTRRGLLAEPPTGSRAGVVPDVFNLLVLGQAVHSQFPANAALLVATPFGLRDVRVVVIDPHRPMTQSPGDPLGPARVLGPDGPGQAVDRVVRQAYRCVFGVLWVGPAEGFHGEHRSERLFLDAAHVARAVVQDRGRVVEAVGQCRIGGALASHPQLRALLKGGGNVGLNLGAVLGADERARLCAGIFGPAQPDACGARSEERRVGKKGR